MGRQAGKETLGERIARLRRAANMTQEELAAKAGEKLSSLRNWEGDRSMPRLPALLRLAEALGVPVERFAEAADDPQQEEPAPPSERPRRRREGKLP